MTSAFVAELQSTGLAEVSIGTWLLLAIAAILIGVVWYYLYWSVVTIFRGAEVVVAFRDNGEWKILDKSQFFWDPRWKLLRGNYLRSTLRISVQDDEGKWNFRDLINPRTGAISLREHLCSPRKFDARSSDEYVFSVKPRVRFKVKKDHDSIGRVLSNADFDQVFKAKIESFFREAIARRDDKQIAREREQINNEVLEKLRAIEAQAPLGVEYLEVLCALVKAPEQLYADHFGGEPDESGGPRSRPREAEEGPTGGAMQHPVSRLDGIRDNFLIGDWENLSEEERLKHYEFCNLCLLYMLDLQSQQNVAEALRENGNVFVLSSENAGMATQSVMREKFRTSFKDRFASGGAVRPARTRP